MKLIPLEFKYDGFSFKQLERVGNIALFEKTHPSADRKFYEVVKIKISPDQTILGKFIPEHEKYPASSEWGELGWSYSILSEAQKQLLLLATAQPNADSSAQPSTLEPPQAASSNPIPGE